MVENSGSSVAYRQSVGCTFSRDVGEDFISVLAQSSTGWSTAQSMEEDSTNVFDDTFDNEFTLPSLSADHLFDLQHPSVDPRVISNHGDLGHTQQGANRPAAWSVGAAPQRAHDVAPKPPPRLAQPPARSVSMKRTPDSGKGTLGLRQEMRSTAHRVRSLGGQLLDIEK
jgi:hypothetical protein